jgi:hypothetical protein
MFLWLLLLGRTRVWGRTAALVLGRSDALKNPGLIWIGVWFT